MGSEGEAHIGYLLGERYWGKGYAKELLSALIKWSSQEGSITKLVAGVEGGNIASSSLLRKLGFMEQEGNTETSVFYEYLLS